MIVADNDVISYFWIELGRTELARNVRRKDAEWAAPFLWRSEFRNVLRKYVNEGYLTLQQALQRARQAEHDLVGSEHHVRTGDVLRLASEAGHSAYDCEYVALAQALGVTLVTGGSRSSFPKRPY